VSDVALNKICLKHNIPKPPLGHWAKLQHGKAAKQVPLPSIGSDADPIIEIKPRIKEEKTTLPEELQTISFEKIQVPTESVRFHPLVSKTRVGFRSATPNEYGRLCPQTTDCLNIAVGKNSIDRALRIWDTLIKELEKSGFTVRAVGGGHFSVRTSEPKTEVLIAEEWVEFRMEERATRSDAPPQPKSHSWSYNPKWIHTPSGRLTILIEGYLGGTCQTSWSDRDTLPLEKNLGAIASGLVEAAAALKRRHLEWKQAEMKRQEQERLAKEAEQKRIKEEVQIRDLEQKAVRWRLSRDISDLVSEVERIVEASNLRQNTTPHLDEWLLEARRHAERLSPIREILEDK